MTTIRKCAIPALVFLVSCAPAQDDGARVIEYSWLTGDRISGQQTANYSKDGAVHISFQYSDRGRGPDFDSLVQLNRDGVPTRYHVSGTNNTKAAIDEQFSVDANNATWRSSVEAGRKSVVGDEFYFPYNDSPEVVAILARVLLKNPEKKVELLPSGQASIEEITKADITLDGDSRELTLYGIYGLDFGPTYVWLDDNNDLFGFTDRTFGIVRKGWESVFPRLKAAEREAASKDFEATSDELGKDLPGLTAILGARIFDSISGELTSPATVFVWNGAISAVDFGDTDIPEDATVIDGSGKTLMPSLWDMHNHVGSGHLLNYLASGVLNVRDTGSRHPDLEQLLDKLQDGSFAGPDIYPLGFIDKRGEYEAPVGKFAEDLDEAFEFVEFYARHGYRGIKLYSSIEPEWVEPITKVAQERGLPVAGHIPAFMSAEQAIHSGFDEITHINMIFLNFLGAEELDTRGPVRFLAPGERGADLDIESDEVNRFISLMKDHQIAHDPTLAVIMEMFRNRPGETSPIFAGIIDHLPGFARRNLIMTENYNQGREEAFARSAQTVLDLVAKLHRDGIRLLPGTDNLLPGFTLIRELIYYNEAGIPTNDVLKIATIEPARHMRLDHRLGSISVGKDAHMYLIDGNPVEDINNLYRVDHVFKGRKLFYAPDILRAQGIVPFVKH